MMEGDKERKDRGKKGERNGEYKINCICDRDWPQNRNSSVSSSPRHIATQKPVTYGNSGADIL